MHLENAVYSNIIKKRTYIILSECTHIKFVLFLFAMTFCLARSNEVLLSNETFLLTLKDSSSCGLMFVFLTKAMKILPKRSAANPVIFIKSLSTGFLRMPNSPKRPKQSIGIDF